jgi:hypothetical protein
MTGAPTFAVAGLIRRPNGFAVRFPTLNDVLVQQAPQTTGSRGVRPDSRLGCFRIRHADSLLMFPVQNG